MISRNDDDNSLRFAIRFSEIAKEKKKQNVIKFNHISGHAFFTRVNNVC